MDRLTIWLVLAGVSAVPGSVAGQDSLKLREPFVRPSLQARPNASREQMTGLVATVALSPASIVLEQGSTQQMAATPQSASGAPLRGAGISWHSSNPAVAQVDANGVVTAVEPGGPGEHYRRQWDGQPRGRPSRSRPFLRSAAFPIPMAMR